MTEGHGAGPPRRLRGILEALLPEDPWAGDFLSELDAEYGRVCRLRGRRRAAAWYAVQLVSPSTARFVWLMRRRNRAHGTGGDMGQGRAGLAEALLGDVRQVTRSLLRQPRFAAFVAATLALGIGANTAVFGVADRVLLRGPEGVVAPRALVRLLLHFDARPGGAAARTVAWVPYRAAEAIREESTAFQGVALYRSEQTLVETPAGIRPMDVGTVGPGFFQLLGTVPTTGRFFGGAGEGGEGTSAVISHRLWTSAFGGAADAVGRSLRVGGRRYTVVAVAPLGFTGPQLEPVDLWVPLDPDRAGNRNWLVMGRLPSGRATSEGAQAAAQEATAIHRRTDPGRSFRWAMDGTITTAPISYDENGRQPGEASVLELLLAVSLLVLVVTVANVVNLFLARLTRRRREIAVRLALGIGQRRLARLFVLEGLLTASLGGLASLPVAWVAGGLLRRILLPGVPWASSPLEGRVLLLTTGVALGAGFVVALPLLYRTRRSRIGQAIRGAHATTGRLRVTASASLVVVQLTLSAALALAAGLFLESFRTLRVTDLGLAAAEVSAVTVRYRETGEVRGASDAERTLYFRAMEAVRGLPGVEDAAVSLGLPYRYNFGVSVSVPGLDSIPALPGGGPYLSAVTPDYFRTMGTRLLEGRAFTSPEVADGEPVIVVGATMARLLWPGEDPLGRCVRVGSASSPCSTVVGVAEDVHRVGYREPPSYQYYVPLGPGNNGFGGMALVLRHPAARALPVDQIRSRITGLDPAIGFVDVLPMDQALAPEVRPWRLGSWTLGVAGLVALLVSVVGVYGVLAYVVEQRTREIGVRLALGASRIDVYGLVVRAGLAAAGLGLAMGTALVAAAGPWVRPLLFETSLMDPSVLAAVAALLLTAVVAACLAPARRAAHIEPAECLKDA